MASEDILDIPQARRMLDEDHFGLKEVKERILEHLGVLKLNPKAKAPILCFVGPPGVGKTSLGQSIARAMGRKFERMSLGGVHDEAELRGHRRTYIGAMPGRIIQAIRRAGVNNPVLMLDEVDKLGRDFRGDPASALLEVLDPEQNRTFRDNYLDLPFDLVEGVFRHHGQLAGDDPAAAARPHGSAPAGRLQRGGKARDRAGGTCFPRQLHEAGLSGDQCVVEDAAVRRAMSRYTREAGVRQLERASAGWREKSRSNGRRARPRWLS